ncbi:hypothetical protein ACFL0H_13855 [Thermodesulfobacteriota bacterium]
MNDIKNGDLILSDQTGALLMLNKKERKMLKHLLYRMMLTEKGKKHITNTLGPEYIEVGEKLLNALGATSLDKEDFEPALNNNKNI